MKKYSTVLALSLIAFLFSPTTCLFSQDSVHHKVTNSLSADLVSRYIWRGQEYGHSPSIQPDLSVSWKSFTLGSWGAYKFTGEGNQETDFYLSREIGPLTFAIWDYWSFCDTSFTDFFDYRNKTTSHLLEGQILLSGGENLPFNLLGSYFFYGADQSRSIYLELQYLCSSGPVEMILFMGFQSKGNYYAPKAGIVNIGCTGSKSIEVTDKFSFPLSISFIINPFVQTAYLVASISI